MRDSPPYASDHLCQIRSGQVNSSLYYYTLICVSKIITNAGILSVGVLGTDFNQILIEIYVISLRKINS